MVSRPSIPATALRAQALSAPRRAPSGIRAMLNTAAVALFLPLSAAIAQMHHVDAPERVTRAIGVYEWTGSLDKPTAARLVPISLFVNSHFEDAGVYLARPVPFALQTGDIYSIEKAGASEGLLDLELARDVVTQRSQADDDPLGTWYGYGAFQPPAPERPAHALHPSAHPAVVVASNDDDDRPHFVTRPGATSTSDTSTPAKGSAGQPSSGSAPPADPDRPQLSRRTGSSTDSSSGTGATPTASTPEPPDNTDPERPTLRRHDAVTESKHHKKESGSGVLPTARSLNDDPDRPTMRRGGPEEEAETPPLTGLPSDLHQAVAVSDAAHRDAHVFARAWESPAEHATTLAEIQKLALAQIAAYLKTNALVAGTPAPVTAAPANTSASRAAEPAGPPRLARGVPHGYGSKPPASQSSGTTAAKTTTARTTARPSTAARRAKLKPAKTPAISLADEQLTPLTLSYGGLPTFVYTAQSPVTVGGPVYLTIVAQRLPSGELQVNLRSVTDAAHLNRVPWLRFVDAVDPDASHRASLLFELRAQGSRQFAFYRLISVNAEQTLVTGVIE